MNRWWPALAFATALGCSGCKSIERLVAEGSYDEAIDRAVSRRRPPKGKQARAWATALQQTGRVDEARGVLLGDYQRGGDLASLLALADLELRAGLPGAAAVHYGRIADLDISRLSGTTDVCALFRRRADAFARAGSGEAAAQDFARAQSACGTPTDARARREDEALSRRIDVAMQAEIDARVANTRCRTADDPQAPCDAPRSIDPAALEATIAEAERAGAAALRAVAAEHRLSLSASQVVTLLVADMRGELGPALLGDDEVRRWVGDTGWSEFAPLVGTRPQGEGAYVQLRLGSVLDEMPVGPDTRRGPTQRVVWAAQATDSAGDEAWRIFAWLGDLGATELSLATAYRPKRTLASKPDAGAPEGPAAGAGQAATGSVAPGPEPAPADAAEATTPDPDAPRHWVTRLPPSVESLQVALTVARLRHSRGSPDLALEIARYGIARAIAAGVDGTVTAAARYAGWHLAYGRFWQALAVADAAPEGLAAVRSAAATGVLLSQGLCGGPCLDDEDAAVVVRVLGQPWIDAAQQSLSGWAMAATVAAGPPSPCPTAAERLAAGGPIGALLTARDHADPALPVALAEVLQSDVTLGCSAHDATVLWQALAPSAAAEAVLELLAHEPEAPTPTVMETLTRLALLADRPARAENLAIAAAGSARDPRAMWRRVAAFADETGHRDLEMMALRETLLHTPRLQAPAVRETLLVEALADATRSWGVTETPAGRESLRRLVDDRVDTEAPGRRWATRDALYWRVAEQAWWATAPDDAPWRPVLEEALRGEVPVAAHALAMSRLGLAEAPPHRSDFDAASLRAQALDGALSQLPPATAAIDDPARLEAVRLAIARHGGDWRARWRTAIGLCVYGSERARSEGLAVLLSMATPAQRMDLVQLALARPAALSSAPGQRPVAQAVVTDDDILFRLAAGLDLAPAWYAR